MTSLEFLSTIINPAREAAGETKVRNNVFIQRIEDEIDDNLTYKIFVSHGKESKVYDLDTDQMMLVGMRLI